MECIMIEELQRLRVQNRKLEAFLEEHAPSAFRYNASIAGIEMAGFSLAQNGHRGGDLAFPIVFAAPENSYTLGPIEKSEAIIHRLKKGPPKIGLFMADAMGHGLIDGLSAAQAYMAARVAVLFELTHHDDVSSNVARTLNNVFYKGVPSPTPLALLLSRFHRDSSDPTKVGASYIAAGNPHPCMLRVGISELEHIDVEKAHTAASLGVAPTEYTPEGNSYSPNRLKLNLGDLMVLHSDGLRDFGRNRDIPYFPSRGAQSENYFLRDLLSVRDRSASEIVDTIYESLLSHCLEREDDITVFVVKNASVPSS